MGTMRVSQTRIVGIEGSCNSHEEAHDQTPWQCASTIELDGRELHSFIVSGLAATPGSKTSQNPALQPASVQRLRGGMCMWKVVGVIVSKIVVVIVVVVVVVVW